MARAAPLSAVSGDACGGAPRAASSSLGRPKLARCWPCDSGASARREGYGRERPRATDVTGRELACGVDNAAPLAAAEAARGCAESLNRRRLTCSCSAAASACSIAPRLRTDDGTCACASVAESACRWCCWCAGVGDACGVCCKAGGAGGRERGVARCAACAGWDVEAGSSSSVSLSGTLNRLLPGLALPQLRVRVS